jgi:glycosyltransferase involved in cell wall biosynthesis
MKIIHLASSAGIGGGERYLLDLIRHADPQMNHTVILPQSGPFVQALQKEAVGHTVVDLGRRWSPSGWVRLVAALRRSRGHLLHTHGYRANFYGRLAAVLCGLPHVCTAHVSLYDYRQTPGWLRFLYITVEKGLSFLSRRIICVSGALLSDLAHMGIAGRRLVLVPNGTDPERFHPRPPSGALRRRLDLAEGHPVIGTVGRLVPEKGQIVLLRALLPLQSSFPGIRCVIVGDGPLRQSLIEAAAELGLEKACRFAGPLEAVEEFYPLLDVFVLPSLREPFGLALLEAMASQVPVAAASAGGPLEIIQPGLNGLLAPPGDHRRLADRIHQLLQDPEMAGRLAAAGYRTVRERFDVRAMVAGVESVYRSILADTTQNRTNRHHAKRPRRKGKPRITNAKSQTNPKAR